MPIPCDSSNFAKIVAGEMLAYTRGVTEKIKIGIDKVSDEVNEEVKRRVPVKTGKYCRAFRVKKSVYEDNYNKRNMWYVAAPHYRLTHLLEYGYLTRNGTTRVAPRPHIIYGQQLAERRMMEIAKGAAAP